MTHRLVSLFLAAVMAVMLVMPVYAESIKPPLSISNVTEYGDAAAPSEAASLAETEEANTEDSSEEAPSAPTGDATDPAEATEPAAATETDAAPSDGNRLPAHDSFFIDCTPEQAAEIIAFYEFVAEQIKRGNRRPRAADGDSGTVSWTWGETVNLDVPSGDPNNPYHIGSLPRITLSTSDMPVGRPFCVEFGVDPGGSYTASEGGDSTILGLLVAFEKGSASAIGVQLALWYLESGVPVGSHPQVSAALSAANSADTTGYTYYEWSGSGQPFVTLDKAGVEGPPDDPTDPSGTEPPTDPPNPNTETVVTTDTETRTEIRQSTEYDYADGIGQISVAKRDQDGNSLDGAIFNIVVEFANGQRGGDSAFEVHNGTRLYTWTHPADDYQPARVTVTEVRAPDGYVGDFTPQTAIVHPTYTRITRVMEHTITITTTTTTTSVINIDTGEVLSESSASADAETELDPPTIQEYTDFIEGDRETVVTFVNQQKAAELIIFKYRSGVGTPLQGAQFEVSYVDPAVHSGRWTVTTGADGKAVISLPKPGAILIHEVSPPAGHVITSAGPDTTVTINAGERKQVDIPNDPFTAVEVLKIDSVTGAPLAGATISIKHVSSGMEFRQVTGADGVARFENVEPGSWYAEEIKAPDRYVLNTTRYPIELKSNETATVTIPDSPYTGIEVTKIDANNGQTLAGAFIRLKHISSGQEYSGTTGADGKVYFGLIPPGEYYVEEVQAPFGYVLNTTRYPLELQSGELATLVLPNHKKDGLYIRKVDENGKPLPGAVFELRRGSGEVLLRDTTDANGQIFREFLSTDTYQIEEISAPVGYLLDENTTQDIFIDQTDDNKLYTVTFVNKKKPSIEIIKVDADNPNRRLQGAVFRISEQGGSKTWDITTGFDGSAVLDNLEIGTTYLVEEKTAPQGYVNSGYREPIVLNECRTHTVTVANSLSPKLRIEKINAATGNKLPGAVFRVAPRGGMEYKDYTTGFDGSVTIDDLTPGWFVVTETRAPSGYALDTKPREIELVAGETSVLTINNERKPSLTVLKIDEITKQPLQYARFRISLKEGKTLGEYTTGADGKIYLGSIDPGLYEILETKVPDGYHILASTKEILVEMGKDVVVEIPNQPVNPLVIKKVDAKTGEPLSGAKFLVTKVNGETVGEFETGQSGAVTVTGQEPGWFTVVETKAPLGYLLDNTAKQIELKMNAPGVVEFENHPLNGLRIVKIDAVTHQPLAGAKFRVTEKGGKTIGEYTTDSRGEIAIDDLSPGWFTITETAAPEGYLIDNVSKDVEFVWGELASVEFMNSRKSPLQIKKVDADSGEPLAGAKFRVTTVEGTFVGDYTSDRYGLAAVDRLSPGWFSITETSAPDGFILDSTPRTVEIKPNVPTVVEIANTKLSTLRIVKTDAVSGKTLPGVSFRVTATDGAEVGEYTTGQGGLVTVPDLMPGSYVVTETKCPDEYQLDSTPKTVVVNAGGTATVEVANSRKAPLQIKKIDAATGEPLAGAVFRVTTVDGSFIGEYTSDRNGFASAGGLEVGWYVVTEIKAVLGYLLDTAPRTVEVKENLPAIVEIPNTKLSTIQIRKTDSATGDVLPGASFRVTATDGTVIGEFTTGTDGLITIPNLHPGSYIISETKCPEGFRLDRNPQTVVVKADSTATADFANDRLPGLQIRKIDSVTGKPLPGARFRLEKANGERVGDYTTNSAGFFVAVDLAPGYFTAYELTAPAGYILDATPQSIQLKANETAVLEFQNKPLAGLQIRKVDAVTGEPLAGVAFSVVKPDGQSIGTFVTDSRGIIFVPDLQEGLLTVTETKALPGYKPDPVPRSVDIRSGNLNVVEYKNQPYPSLQIKKTDAVTGKAIPGVVFKVYDADTRELGEYTTNDLGVIRLTGMEAGTFYIREVEAAEGFVLDDSLKEVTLRWGQTAEVAVKNVPMGTLRLIKVDSVTGEALPDAGFILYDAKSNIVGEYVTDENGLVVLPQSLAAGAYSAKEVKAPEGHVLLEKPVSFTIKAGETQEVVIPNAPVRGRIRIVKKADADNPLTDDEKGDALAGAVFEILDEDENVVDTITTDSKGVAETEDLPIGKYAIRETAAPELFILNDAVFYGEIKLHGDLVKFEVLNKPAELGVTVEKQGPAEAETGDLILYEFSVSNDSNVPLENFFLHDAIPTDVLRLEKLVTGTYSEKLRYKVTYRTNRENKYRVWKDKLSTEKSEALEIADLRLDKDELVTDFRLEFGTVPPGFCEDDAPNIETWILADLSGEPRIVNEADAEGEFDGEAITGEDSWVTVAYDGEEREALPRTGR